MKTIISFIKRLLKSKKQELNNRPRTSKSITRDQHNISKTDISINALKVLNRLCKAGYEAYLVGGSVRDLLLHKAPKDFDIATNASPNQIKQLFRNSRIIGRRFRLVHILFHREVIEVATFRGHEPCSDNHKKSNSGMLIRDNVYGTIDEDAWRRDFTINALFYDHRKSSIIDFTSGFEDIKNKTIRIIGDATTRYQEDPVRMLRALRFCAKLDFTMCPETAEPIKKSAYLLNNVSSSRLSDEVAKLYHGGSAVKIQQLLEEYQLFQQLFPLLDNLDSKSYPVASFIHNALENTDTRIREGRTVNPAFLFAVILWFPLLEQAFQLEQEGIPPLPALEKAMRILLNQQQKTVSIPKRYTIIMREIWLLQYRFPKRFGIRPFKVVEHPRFRAAYDFLLLRALAGDESIELADWWSTFQEVAPDEQKKMIRLMNKKRQKAN